MEECRMEQEQNVLSGTKRKNERRKTYCYYLKQRWLNGEREIKTITKD